MKIIIVGSDRIFSIENFYVKYLREYGVEVILFTAQNFFYNYYERSIFNKVFFRIGISKIINDINSSFKILVEKEQPDIIWVFKGMEIQPQSLQWAKNRGIRLVNYNPDNPFLFSGAGSGNANITRSISLYDLHFTYSLEIQKQLERDFTMKTSILPFGFDIDENLFKLCADQPELNEVCFLGNPDKERAGFIRSLADNGVRVTVYGNNWSRFLSHPLITPFRPVYGDEQWRVLRKYRVQLNLMRRHNLNSHNMRTFEVPGVGGVMLAPNTTEHRIFFEENKEIFLFSDVSDCIRKINNILSLPSKDVLEIRNSARKRSITSHYTYKDRARQALDELEHLTN